MKEVLYFSASWCVPCKQMKPIVEQLEADTGISFRKIDIDSDHITPEKYRVMSVPSFVLVDENNQEISRAVGAQTGKELSAALAL
jgi:thioredoxin 1